jgi:hypothetical protein
MLSHLTSVPAQVHIGSDNPPKPSAILEVSATDKGILLPAVALKAVNDSLDIAGNKLVDGLLVFNTTKDAFLNLHKGLYAWNSVKRLWENIVSDQSFHDMLTLHYATEDACFIANITTKQSQTLPTGKTGKLTFSSGINMNKGNCFNTNTDEFVIPETGFYKIVCGMEIRNSDNNTVSKDDKASIQLVINRLSLKKEDVVNAVVTRSFITTDSRSLTTDIPLTPSLMYSGPFEKGDKISVNGRNDWKVTKGPGYINRKYLYINTF